MNTPKKHVEWMDVSTKKHSVCIVSESQRLAKRIGCALRDVINTYGYRRVAVMETPVIKEEQNEFECFGNARYVVLCSECGSKDDIFSNGTDGALWKWYRRALDKGAKVCMFYINHGASGLIDDNTLYSRDLTAPCQRHVQISAIEKDGLFLSFGKMDGFRFNSAQKHAIKDWFGCSVQNTIEDHLCECWREITQALRHDLRLVIRESRGALLINWVQLKKFYVNNQGALFRLIPMTVIGMLSVFLTLLFLSIIASITDDEYTRIVKQTRSSLRHELLSRRDVNMEWEWRYNGIAVLALQMNYVSWTTEIGEDSRTRDRLEISLLAALSRCKSIELTGLRGARFPQYVSALAAIGWDVRHFHSHNLVQHLQDQVSFIYAYEFPGIYTYSWALIALCNAHASLPQQYIDQLLHHQSPDGSFINSIDESAMAVIALSCFKNNPDVTDSISRTIQYMYRQRNPKGSYGNIYTTSLVLQAFKAANYTLSKHHETKSLYWLSRSAIKRKTEILNNIPLTSHILAALSGKTYNFIGTETGQTCENSRG